MTSLTLNIIGAGKLGQTLGRLWQQQSIFALTGICNRSLHSAQAACAFIGAGQAYQAIEQMPPADCWLIATADSDIAPTAEALANHLAAPAQADKSLAAPLVFHCSGALPASILACCRPASIASAHPVHSFADPQRSLETLAGSTVAVEGDEEATPILQRAFSALACDILNLNAEQKVLYHSGSVMACNYLTVLLDQSLKVFQAAGIDEQSARKLLEPIVSQTVHNNFAMGPAQALTGPIARGDADTIARQVKALQKTDKTLLETYRTLGLAGIELAKQSGLEDEKARQLENILREPSQ